MKLKHLQTLIEVEVSFQSTKSIKKRWLIDLSELQ